MVPEPNIVHDGSSIYLRWLPAELLQISSEPAVNALHHALFRHFIWQLPAGAELCRLTQHLQQVHLLTLVTKL